MYIAPPAELLLKHYLNLFGMHDQNDVPMLDMITETHKLLLAEFPKFWLNTHRPEEELKKVLEIFEHRQKELDERLQKKKDQFENRIQSVSSPLARGLAARYQFGLMLTALEELEKPEAEQSVSDPAEAIILQLELVELLSITGQPERAYEKLNKLLDKLQTEKIPQDTPVKFTNLLLQTLAAMRILPPGRRNNNAINF